MNWLFEVIRSIWRLFIWWTVIQPWELGLRVRLGKKRKLLGPGPHFRVPYLDAVYKQSVRLRYTTVSPQTVTTRDGYTLTISGQLGYAIVDIDRLYDTLHQAENALRSMVQGAVAEYVHQHTYSECSPRAVAAGATATLGLGTYGLVFRTLQLTTFCRIRAYRLIMDREEQVWEDLLNTRIDDSQPVARN